MHWQSTQLASTHHTCAPTFLDDYTTFSDQLRTVKRGTKTKLNNSIAFQPLRCSIFELGKKTGREGRGGKRHLIDWEAKKTYYAVFICLIIFGLIVLLCLFAIEDYFLLLFLFHLTLPRPSSRWVFSIYFRQLVRSSLLSCFIWSDTFSTKEDKVWIISPSALWYW